MHGSYAIFILFIPGPSSSYSVFQGPHKYSNKDKMTFRVVFFYKFFSHKNKLYIYPSRSVIKVHFFILRGREPGGPGGPRDEKYIGYRRGPYPHDVCVEMSVFSSFWDSARKSIYEFNTASEKYSLLS